MAQLCYEIIVQSVPQVVQGLASKVEGQSTTTTRQTSAGAETVTTVQPPVQS